jgi:hypothetical protein
MGKYSQRADLWSLGLVLCELATDTAIYTHYLNTRADSGVVYDADTHEKLRGELAIDTAVHFAAVAVPQLGVLADGFLRVNTAARLTLREAQSVCESSVVRSFALSYFTN